MSFIPTDRVGKIKSAQFRYRQVASRRAIPIKVDFEDADWQVLLDFVEYAQWKDLD